MSPSFSIYNKAYRILAYVETFCYLALCQSIICINSSDFDNLGFIKFCKMALGTMGNKFWIFSQCIAIPYWGIVTFFYSFILHIICVRSYKKMVWIYATWNIAFVKHAHSGRNIALVNSIGKAMRTFGGPAKPKISIPIFVAAGSPNPAINLINYRHFIPKTFGFFLGELDGWVKLAYGLFRFIHIRIMFGFSVIAGADYIRYDAPILADLTLSVK